MRRTMCIASVLIVTVLAPAFGQERVNRVKIDYPETGYVYLDGESRFEIQGSQPTRRPLRIVLSDTYAGDDQGKVKTGRSGVAHIDSFKDARSILTYAFDGVELESGYAYVRMEAPLAPPLPAAAYIEAITLDPQKYLPTVKRFLGSQDPTKADKFAPLKELPPRFDDLKSLRLYMLESDDEKLAEGFAEVERENEVLLTELRLLMFPYIVTYRTVGGADGTDIVVYVEGSGDIRDVYYMFVKRHAGPPADKLEIGYYHRDEPLAQRTIVIDEPLHYRKFALVKVSGEWCVTSFSDQTSFDHLPPMAKDALCQARDAAHAAGLPEVPPLDCPPPAPLN